MLILNTTMHLNTGLSVEPFGDDGAMRLVPIDGAKPGRAFILDAEAIATLAEFITRDES